MAENNFANLKLQIITYAGVRYVGLCVTVSKADKSIVLKSVKSYGTENRPCACYIPPREHLWETLTLRAQEISSIVVLKDDDLPTLSVEETEPLRPPPPEESFYLEVQTASKTASKVPAAAAPQTPNPYYNQPDFFDNLSSSVTADVRQRREGAIDRINYETFGTVSQGRRPNMGSRRGAARGFLNFRSREPEFYYAIKKPTL